MLVYDFIVMDMPFDRACVDFASLRRDVVAGVLGASLGATSTDALRRTAERRRDDAVVIGFSWRMPSETDRAIVRLEGELQCAPLDDGRTHLSVSGSYETSASPVRAPARAREHREVEIRVRAFLRGLRAALSLPASGEEPKL
jgi:hypothetical protein